MKFLNHYAYAMVLTAVLCGGCSDLKSNSDASRKNTPIKFSNDKTTVFDFPIEFLSDWVDDYIVTTRTSRGNWKETFEADSRDYGSNCEIYTSPISQPNGIADNIERYFCQIRTKGNKRHIFRFLVRPVFKEHLSHYSQFNSVNSSLNQENQEILNAWITAPDYVAFMTTEGGGFDSTWEWQHQLNSVLTPLDGYIDQVNKAAKYAGVKLSIVIRPFEASLSTYRSIPVFNSEGAFLKNYLPSGSVELSQAVSESGMTHYRQILSQVLYGEKNLVTVDKVDFLQAENVTTAFLQNPSSYINIYSTPYPPIDPDSNVFVRGSGGGFSLVKYQSIKALADAKRYEVQNFSVSHQNGVLSISGIDMPADHGYLVFEGVNDAVNLPRVNEAFDSSSVAVSPERKIILSDKHGIKMGRIGAYWTYHNYIDVKEQSTLYAGFKTDDVWTSSSNTFSKKGSNDLRSIFSVSRSLKSSAGVAVDTGALSMANKSLVVVVGEEYSNELFDFSKDLVVNHYKEKVDFYIGNYSEFDDVLVNSRTHSDLIQNLEEAYLPSSILKNEEFINYIKSIPISELEQFTFRYAGERKNRQSCQQEGCLDKFRYFKQKQQAIDLTKLLYEVRKIAPDNRMRVIGEMTDSDYVETFDFLENTINPSTSLAYGESYISSLYPSNNYYHLVSDSITNVDFDYLKADLVMQGVRGVPEQPAVNYVMQKRAIQATNRYGKDFADVFYGAQETLSNDAKREDIICDMLTNHNRKFKKIILYEGITYLWYRNTTFNDFLSTCSN